MESEVPVYTVLCNGVHTAHTQRQSHFDLLLKRRRIPKRLNNRIDGMLKASSCAGVRYLRNTIIIPLIVHQRQATADTRSEKEEIVRDEGRWVSKMTSFQRAQENM